MSKDAILSIQDMGAAGLTSSSVEMAAKGDTGIEIDLDKVPLRASNMDPYEIMLSESQERMLMVLKPEKIEEATEIFKKWGLEFAVIGTINDSKRIILKKDNNSKLIADIPISALSSEAPVYEREYTNIAPRADIDYSSFSILEDKANEALIKLISCPDLCSKRWIYEQYDSMVMADTIRGPGSDAAVVRVHNSTKALALTSDCTPRYCYADPAMGAKCAVAESWRNLISVGAKPLAITNCLNFGNPEKPEIMGQLVSCIEGIAEACKALDYPVVSGNVSLYNETSGNSIYPTPTIGGVGIISDVTKTVSNCFTKKDEIVIVIGESKGHLGSSLYLREVHGKNDGSCPPVDLLIEKNNGQFVSQLIGQGKVSACHDIADGGLYVAIAEMTFSALIGASISLATENLAGSLFGEDQSRYIITCKEEQVSDILDEAKKAGVMATKIGKTGGNELVLNEKHSVAVKDLLTTNESILPNLMNV
jgi:phosphoribosylformylglycinamidine synthase